MMSRFGTRCHRAERLGRCLRCGFIAPPVGTDKHPGNHDGCAAQLEPAGNLAQGLQGEPSGSVSIAALPSAAEFLIPPTLIRLAGHGVSITLTDDDVAEALRLLRSSPGMANAKEMVRRYAANARDELAALPDSPGRQALAALVDYTVNRHG